MFHLVKFGIDLCKRIEYRFVVSSEIGNFQTFFWQGKKTKQNVSHHFGLGIRHSTTRLSRYSSHNLILLFIVVLFQHHFIFLVDKNVWKEFMELENDNCDIELV